MEIGVNGEIGRIVQRLVLAERRIGLEHVLTQPLNMAELTARIPLLIPYLGMEWWNTMYYSAMYSHATQQSVGYTLSW